MEVTHETLRRVPVLRVGSSLDSQTSPELRKLLGRCLKRSPAGLVVNLSAVGAMDTAGLATLIEASQRLKKHGRALLLVGVGDSLMRVVHLSQAEALFEFFDTEQEAVASIAQ